MEKKDFRQNSQSYKPGTERQIFHDFAHVKSKKAKLRELANSVQRGNPEGKDQLMDTKSQTDWRNNCGVTIITQKSNYSQEYCVI